MTESYGLNSRFIAMKSGASYDEENYVPLARIVCFAERIKSARILRSAGVQSERMVVNSRLTAVILLRRQSIKSSSEDTSSAFAIVMNVSRLMDRTPVSI